MSIAIRHDRHNYLKISPALSSLLAQANTFERLAWEAGNIILALKHRAIRRSLERLAFEQGGES